MDYRLELLKEYRELLLNWDNNNMLYNSLKFYKIYNGDVEYNLKKSQYFLRKNAVLCNKNTTASNEAVI